MPRCRMRRMRRPQRAPERGGAPMAYAARQVQRVRARRAPLREGARRRRPRRPAARAARRRAGLHRARLHPNVRKKVPPSPPLASRPLEVPPVQVCSRTAYDGVARRRTDARCGLRTLAISEHDSHLLQTEANHHLTKFQPGSPIADDTPKAGRTGRAEGSRESLVDAAEQTVSGAPARSTRLRVCAHH